MWHHLVGKRLEAVDLLNPSIVAPATVVAVQSDDPAVCQVHVHFDGWGASYDYWDRLDSTNLAPVGTCERRGIRLSKPGHHPGHFDWQLYLRQLNTEAVSQEDFVRARQPEYTGEDNESADALLGRVPFFVGHPVTRLNGDSPPAGEPPSTSRPVVPPVQASDSTQRPEFGATTELWRVGAKLEAIDRQYPHLVAVASVLEVRPDWNMVLITFDGWSPRFNYWVSPCSTDVAPVGTCATMGVVLEAPRQYQGTFTWSHYLHETSTEPVPTEGFGDRSLENSDFFCSRPIRFTAAHAAPSPSPSGESSSAASDSQDGGSEGDVADFDATQLMAMPLEAAMRLLPPHRYNDRIITVMLAADTPDCAICQEPLSGMGKEDIYLTRCAHWYCCKCLARHYAVTQLNQGSRPRCPLCRARLAAPKQ
jgi:hypothetical protein